MNNVCIKRYKILLELWIIWNLPYQFFRWINWMCQMQLPNPTRFQPKQFCTYPSKTCYLSRHTFTLWSYYLGWWWLYPGWLGCTCSFASWRGTPMVRFIFVFGPILSNCFLIDSHGFNFWDIRKFLTEVLVKRIFVLTFIQKIHGLKK